MSPVSLRTDAEEGFTLIELLVVIVVIGILATIVTIGVGSTRGDAISSACKTNFKSVELSAESVYSKTGTYPTVVNDLLIANGKGGVLKDYPTSSDYVLTYSSASGTSYAIDVKETAAGPSLGTTAADCDDL